jgi:hypothetical protein
MFITMLADMTAFVCLVFGYFFFWTVHEDFPPVAMLRERGRGRFRKGGRLPTLVDLIIHFSVTELESLLF